MHHLPPPPHFCSRSTPSSGAAPYRRPAAVRHSPPASVPACPLARLHAHSPTYSPARPHVKSRRGLSKFQPPPPSSSSPPPSSSSPPQPSSPPPSLPAAAATRRRPRRAIPTPHGASSKESSLCLPHAAERVEFRWARCGGGGRVATAGMPAGPTPRPGRWVGRARSRRRCRSRSWQWGAQISRQQSD